MEAELLAHIEPHNEGWAIRIIDKSDNEYTICKELETFASAIAVYGTKHNNSIKVLWSKDEQITPEQFNEIEKGVRALEALVRKP